MNRTFRDIPKGKIADADASDYLVSLGYTKGVTWDRLLQSSRILLIAKAGAGKTYECRTQCDALKANGESAFFLELASLSQNPVRELLSREEEDSLDRWLTAEEGIATFFVDSIDELKLTTGSLDVALKKLAKTLSGQLGRARIVVTSRPVAFDADCFRRHLPIPAPNNAGASEETFADVAMGERRKRESNTKKDDLPPPWRTVGLMPLSNDQIHEFAAEQGVSDPQALLEDICQRQAQDFARRPQDLVELCADWKIHKRIRTHSDQVDTNIRVKLVPSSERGELAELSPDKARQGARRLALAVLLSRKLTLRHSAAADDIESGDEGALDPADILTDWTDVERKALLERPLFGFASYGRVRFHHRSVIEYLAAEQLAEYAQNGLSTRGLKSVLFAETDGRNLVRPSLRPVAAWLATKRQDVFQALRDHEPDVLFNEGDPEALNETQRVQALQAYVARHGVGGWRGLQVPGIQTQRFAFPGLAETINTLWAQGIENPDVREVFFELIEYGRLKECRDIPVAVAFDPTQPQSERLRALRALIALDDPVLPDLCVALAAQGSDWSEELTSNAISLLFPEHLSVKQLLDCLEWLQPNDTTTLDRVSWSIPRDLVHADLLEVELIALRNGLVRLVNSDLRWDPKSHPHLQSQHRHLSELLAACCLKGLNDGEDVAWLEAASLATRFPERSSHRDTLASELKVRLEALSAAAAERLFWIDDAFLRALHTPKDDWSQVWAILSEDGPFCLNRSRDRGWLLACVGDATRSREDRSLALQIAMVYLPFETRNAHAADLLERVADDADFLDRVRQWSIPPERNDKPEQWKRKRKRRARTAKGNRRRHKARQSWIDFWCEIEADPDTALSKENIDSTVHNLSRAMGHSLEDYRRYGWNAAFLRQHFPADTVEAIRSGFMRGWRKIYPTLTSERPPDEANITYTNWSFGLTGLHAEAELAGWARKLSSQEAERAARHAPVQLNGFPTWMEDLIEAHPAAVDNVLGEELTLYLNATYVENRHGGLLQDISYATPGVASFFCERILQGLEDAADRDGNEMSEIESVENVRRAVSTLVRHGSDPQNARLKAVVELKLQRTQTPERRLVWLRALFKLSFEQAAIILACDLAEIPPGKATQATQWLGSLFGDHGDTVDIGRASPEPRTLLSLVGLSYTHIRREDDNVRASGSYTADARDTAERARNTLLSSVLALPGETGLQAKFDLSKSAHCTHFKDRILAIAREQRAQEAEAAPYSSAQLAALHRTKQPQIVNNDAMLDVMVHRIHDLEDLLISDTSPREAWAPISKEYIMRRVIAHEIERHGAELYTVDMEAVTSEEKETDIRLRSIHSSHEGVIELKLAEKWSGRVLLETLETQLVGRYLMPEYRKSGVLLLTLATPGKTWVDPDTTERMDAEALLTRLQVEARRLEDTSGGTLRLAVHMLDLTSMAAVSLKKSNSTTLELAANELAQR